MVHGNIISKHSYSEQDYLFLDCQKIHTEVKGGHIEYQSKRQTSYMIGQIM